MKNLFALATVDVSDSACAKDPVTNTPAQELVSNLKFTANGKVIELNESLAMYSYKGSIFRRGGNYSTGNYTLEATDEGTNNSVWFPLLSSTLSVTMYNVIVPTPNLDLQYQRGGANVSGVRYFVINSGDNFTATITSIHDGTYADGTFSAEMSGTGTTKILITSGEFKNVKIRL